MLSELFVLDRIKETGQIDKLNNTYAELSPDFLFLCDSLYEAAKIVIPKDYTIIDLGCYMAPQAFLFEDYKKYIGVDIYDGLSIEQWYIPPERFLTNNSEHIVMDIADYVKKYKGDKENTFVLMGAVPNHKELNKIVTGTFSNYAIEYPGEEGIYKGKYSENIKDLSERIKRAHCPYTKVFLQENPDIERRYIRKESELRKFIEEKYKGKSIINDIDNEIELEL